MERTCKKCGEIKQIKEFTNHSPRFVAGDYICKLCKKEILKGQVKKYNKIHKKQIKSAKQKYYSTHKSLFAKISKKFERKTIENMTDRWIIILIKQSTKLSKELIKQNPDLIELYRTNLKLKRLIKKQQYEKCNRPEK
jgi:superfamily II helicase